MSSIGKLALGLLDDLAVNLVGPATIVAESSGGLGSLHISPSATAFGNRDTHVKALGSTESLAVVESFNGSQNVDITLNQLGDLDENLAALKARHVGTPSGVECDASGIESLVDIGFSALDDLGDLFAIGGVDDTALLVLTTCMLSFSKRESSGDSLDRLAALRVDVFAIDPETGRDLNLALVRCVVKVVGVGRRHFECCYICYVKCMECFR